MANPDLALDVQPDRPLILLSNDDGVDARGLAALAATLHGLGTIAVVAPVQEQSAVGHSITIHDPIRAHPWAFEVSEGPIWARAVTGTPADCVKLAAQKLLPRKPDLVVSGINHGPNTAVSVIYSGTVSAATEAAILGVPSFAVSHCSWEADIDFEAAVHYARLVADRILEHGLQAGVLLNVNVPDLPMEHIRGVRVTRLARARWEEEFEERRDPFDKPYYWMGGKFINLDDGRDTDLHAIDQGYVSITPIHYDLTAYDHLSRIKGWDWRVEPAKLRSLSDLG